MKLFKDFAFGAVYLVSGIYSLGFSMALTEATKALSGTTAYVTVPDGLFPLEVSLFTLFGLAFLGASFYHFRASIRLMSEKQSRLGGTSFVG
ncbi:MAG TPA: hypothetical protein VGR56_08870 [Nitrososphaerales archaeon]|nr:hypothetical protein [Nitrososphaerales archaeon]